MHIKVCTCVVCIFKAGFSMSGLQFSYIYHFIMRETIFKKSFTTRDANS